MKKILKRSFIAIAVSVIIIAAGAWAMFAEIIKAANSIKKLENGLYFMEFIGDYGFDDFLKKGGADSDGAVADYLTGFLSRGFYGSGSKLRADGFGCSTICTQDKNGTYFFGRNYDWEECRAMIVHTKPKNGYESVSTCCIDFLGFGEKYVPDGSMTQRVQSIAAIYVPLDGMNAEGLTVADLMAGDDAQTHQNRGKTALTTTTAIRLLLDKAANVEEAVALLKQYDMNSSIGAAHHLAIADDEGNSVVVEYINDEMIVTEAKIVTNHYLSDCEKKGVGSEQSHLRYDTLAAHSGKAGAGEIRRLLESVAQKNYPQEKDKREKTMWSIVYCPEKRYADFCFAENFEHSYRLLLSEKGAFIKR